MVKIDLSKYGITNVEKIIYNPSYDELFKQKPIRHSPVMKKA